jgi:hypothetical protein
MDGWTPETLIALRNDLHASHKLTRELLQAVREQHHENLVRSERARAAIAELRAMFIALHEDHRRMSVILARLAGGQPAPLDSCDGPQGG